MKVIILGSGVIGVTTAYFLQKAGCEVVVLDRHEKPAMESSHANGSQLSYSHCQPLASIGNIKKALKWIGKSDAPLLIRPRIDWSMYSWLIKFLFEAKHSNYTFNTEALARLTFYSRAVLHDLMSEHNLDFDWNNKGLLHIFKTKEDLDDTKTQFDFLSSISEAKYKVLTKKQCISLEPATQNLMENRYGGIHGLKDETGDVYKFTLQLESICKKMGVKFIYNCNIESIKKHHGHITGIKTDTDFITGDRYVVCLGAYTPKFLNPLGIKLPIYPVKGYSISVPTGKKYLAPKSTISDHFVKTVYTRMGDVLRISGTAEFNGYNHNFSRDRLDPMLNLAKKSFANAGDYNHVQEWACLRPLTPSNRPIISKTKYPELYVNSGHGFLGWTEACGSAKLLKQIILEEITEIQTSGFSIIND